MGGKLVAIQPSGQPTVSIAPRVKPEGEVKVEAPVTGIHMSKEWVLPPRPKPGRKPSAEAPPTKRKAQNRAAQRAFRERRAARVFELEERLQELEAEKDEKETRLVDTLDRINSENAELRTITEELKRQLDMFKVYQSQQAANNMMSPDAKSALSPSHLASPAPSPGSSDQVYAQALLDKALEERLQERLPVHASAYGERARRAAAPQWQAYGPASPAKAAPPAAKDDDDSCGLCHRDGNCMCSDLGLKPDVETFPKDMHAAAASPAAPAAPAKRGIEAEWGMEMDFTHAYSSKTYPIKRRARGAARPEAERVYDEASFSQSPRVTDPCGFCSSGTPCICAEAAGEQERDGSGVADSFGGGSGIHMDATTLPPLRNDAARDSSIKSLMPTKLMTLHPEPTNDVHSPGPSTPGPAPAPAAGGCGGGANFAPGTCDMCQKDPMQTLFCTSLAANKKAAGGGCCGGGDKSGGGCCGGAKRAPVETSNAFIPCSAAYQTLSRHKGFKAVELPSLVRRLNTQGGQVEVSSIASMLRELDRRLYN
ncbi:uncharacterized protein V1510DRAFT_437877 [Dipodascopsis tothii]|uniref:uncharacterized protein n=1 Tax=Dipodascopsis tothii TaxID=44089 RepID=UPI0034CEAD67